MSPANSSSPPDLYRLSGMHNPTATTPSFLLPVFDGVPKRNALYLQTLAGDATTVASFEVLTQEFAVEATTENLDMRIGDSAIFAFAIKNQLLIGTRSDLTAKLIPFVDDPTLLSLPILRLEVIDFCDLAPQRKLAATRAYEFLEKVSRFSADYWRDRTYLTSRARSILRRFTEMAGGDDISTWWESVTFRLEGGQPTLAFNENLGEFLEKRASKNWRSTLARELSVYVSAFGENLRPLEFEIKQSPADPQVSEDTLDPLTGVASESASIWLTVAFGRNAARVSKQISRLPQLIVGVDPQVDHRDEISVDSAIQKLVNFPREHQSVMGRSPMIFLVVDAHSQHFSTALSFVRKLPTHLVAHGVILYRTREGVRNLPSKDSLADLAERIASVTVVPDNEIPLGDSLSNTTLSTSLSSLAPLLVSRIDRSISRDSRVVSLFGMGWTRAGFRGYQQAISRSVAAATNPWLPISEATSALAIFYSVGRPPDAFSVDANQLFNELVKPNSLQGIELVTEWRKRRFVPSGSVPARFEFLAEVGLASRLESKGGFASAARTILSAQGFSVSEVEGQRDAVLKAEGKRGAIEILNTDDVDMRSYSSTPYVLLMRSRLEQQEFLKRSGDLTAIYPLLLGDLFFLNGEKGPLWSAQVLAHRAYPRVKWSIYLRSFLEGTVLADAKENPERYVSFGQIPGRTLISSVSITLSQSERLPGRRMTIYGSMLINFETISITPVDSPSPESHERMFKATLGPDEFRVE